MLLCNVALHGGESACVPREGRSENAAALLK